MGWVVGDHSGWDQPDPSLSAYFLAPHLCPHTLWHHLKELVVPLGTLVENHWYQVFAKTAWLCPRSPCNPGSFLHRLPATQAPSSTTWHLLCTTAKGMLDYEWEQEPSLQGWAACYGNSQSCFKLPVWGLPLSAPRNTSKLPSTTLPASLWRKSNLN